jgi:hypothetical protein
LRRVRPLRGIEGIDDIPAVGPSVAAVEEVILRIADTSATVGPGHLVLFRRARQALDEVATHLIRGARPDPEQVGEAEIEALREQVLDSPQREITWISEFFHDEPGPHVERCPMADRGAGSWDEFFKLEATGGLDTIDRLRSEMARDPAAAVRSATRLASTFRQIRERAVAFGYPEFGRIARRAGATVRAAVGGPASRQQAIAVDLAMTVAALRSYLETEEPTTRARALIRADDSLEALTHPVKDEAVPIHSLTYSPRDALARAKSLWSEASERLNAPGTDIAHAQTLLEEAIGLIEHALTRTGS